MRINWFSNAPYAPTGYGNQTKVFVPRLAQDHKMTVTAFYGHEGSPISWGGITIFGRGFHPYGQDVISAHATASNADLIISLLDIWVMQPELLQNHHWAAWFPIDHEPLPERVSSVAKKAWARIVMSKFGARMCDEAGIDYDYIPHGVETEIFKPYDKIMSRVEAKLPVDKFIVGMVAANKGNPPRKAFFQNIAAFAQFKKTRPESVLYLHTADGRRYGGGESVDLPTFVERLGLKWAFIGDAGAKDADVIFSDPYLYLVGYPDDALAKLYSAFDVHLLVSMGEGFGIPILEAQSCGCPVIVGDWTSMSELCFGGWKVAKSEAEPFYTPLAAYQYMPHADAIARKLEAAYKRRNDAELRAKAREGALEYDANIVYKKYWQPVLEKYAARIEAERRSAPGA